MTQKERVAKEVFIEGLVKHHKLTPHGVIKLGLFDLPTLQVGYTKAQNQYGTNKVAIILNHCIQTYKNNNRKVSWQDYYAELKEQGIESSSPIVDIPNSPKISTHSKIKIIYRDVLKKGLAFLGNALPPEIIQEIQGIIDTGRCPYPEFLIQSTKPAPQSTETTYIDQSHYPQEERSLKLIFVTEQEDGNELRVER